MSLENLAVISANQILLGIVEAYGLIPRLNTLQIHTYLWRNCVCNTAIICDHRLVSISS